MLPSRVLFTRFHEFCRRRRLIAPGGRVVVAVSGGIDSVVLLDLLAEERNTLQLELAVAHCNHGLRGEESEGDEAFVRDRAARYGFPVYVERVDTRERALNERKGIQETARALRYEFLQGLCGRLGFNAVATAHNADDNAETVIMHMMRGTGLRGLSGIPLEREGGLIIRPLLFAGRDAIQEYAAARHLVWREDSSNAADHYTRNIIRHRILPEIRSALNPSVSETLLHQAELLRDLNAYLEASARQLKADLAEWLPEDACALDLMRLSVLPALLRQYVVLALVEETTGTRPDWLMVEAVLDLVERPSGTWTPLPSGWLAARDRERIVMRRATVPPEFSVKVEAGGEYDLGWFRLSVGLLEEGGTPGPADPGRVEYADAELVGEAGMVVRPWREGDWFVPLGMTGRKKVSDYLIDVQIPLFEKQRYPVLETAAGEIVWLCGQRLDDRFKLTARTRRILKLAFIPIVSERDHAPDHHGKR